ncbi:hypothetical protein ZYGM_001466 [Zygosaccharomyces mellis]|uniref:Nucleolar protein Dnt1-like N-terminal domain-containing protein n=1 Tax=Zygosaccharomyces mellis TaxID=42258 RepID=A0A4C2EEP7_9SACH|nr:hypothetical protein ZYGM_001466 [Zygosaccharomyces mellis]
MFKLQVVLVPPSAQSALLPYGLASSTAESSQLLGVNPLTSSRNPDSTLPYAPSGNASSILPHHFTTKLRKFLHFTKSANTLLELSAEIVEKCNKMYPYVDEIEILSLQDSQGCDLDPDFLVKDVFTIDNVVRAIVKNELEIEDSSPVSSYRAAKRKRLNNGSVQNSAPKGVLNVTKKRPAAFAMRNPPMANNASIIGSSSNNINAVNNNMRVSTPLAHQIYPPPSEGDQVRMDSNNSEDEDEEQGERSFLPPPTQPQSPPIRVSSGIDQNKKIKSMVDEDTVSRSETVDPDKLRQQRLLSGTPVRPTMTPNRVTLTGQRVVSENQPAHLANLHSSRKPSSATRITSGRLSIPEPKISEIEKELKEGPSSPSSVLPPRPNRIPMKRPLQEAEAQQSADQEDEEEQEQEQEQEQQEKQEEKQKEEEEKKGEGKGKGKGKGKEKEEEEESGESEKKVRQFIQRQTSIADNNGSPTKNSPLSEGNVHLAELPQARPSSTQSQPQRKTSLEARVQHKSASGGNLMDEERLRIDNFSEDDAEGLQEKEHDRQLEGELDRGTRQLKSDTVDHSLSVPTQSVDTDDSDNEAANDTVVVRGTQSKSSGNHSINREELLRFMEGDYSPTRDRQSSKRKPYTTVLHKDIDNSKPDPRNILPEKMTRGAAKKAAQLLASREDGSSESESELEIEESSSEDDSSGVEFDGPVEDSDDRVSIAENNSVRTLNIHPLKETVVKTDEQNDQHNDSDHSEGTSFASSESENGHSTKDGGQFQASKLAVQDPNLQKSNSSVFQPTSVSKGPPTKQQEKFSATKSSPQNATLSQFRSQMLNVEKDMPKPLPSSFPLHNFSGTNPWDSASPPKFLPPSDEVKGFKSLEYTKNSNDSNALKETVNQTDLENIQKDLNEPKKLKEESEAKKKQEEQEKLMVKQRESEIKKKEQQEELERLKQQQFKRQQEELERRKREFYEKKKQEEIERQKREQENRRKEAEAEKKRIEVLEKQRREEKRKQQDEIEKKKKQEELEKRKQQDEIEKKKKQEELEKRKQQEELEKKKQQDELEKKKKQEESAKSQQEELEKKKQEELEKEKQQDDSEKKRQQGELEKKKREKAEQDQEKRDEIERKRKEDLQRKRQTEVGKKQEESQKKKQTELNKKKQQDEKKTKSSAKSTISKPASAKSPAITNGSDKLKELKARFTSPKAYVPTPGKSNQRTNKESENEESESSDDESSTEYSSSSSEDEDESSSRKSRRMVVDTPKGSVTSGKQKNSPKKVPLEDGIEAAPQSTQRSNTSSQRSQGETPISKFFHSPGRGQSQPKTNSSILDGLPKKVRPSLSSLSDLASRGVPEVKEKATSLSPPPQVTRSSQKVESDSDEDDSDENDGSDTESESSDSDSGDSDSGSSGFISAKTAGSALGKKKKSGGGFASLLRDSQRR